MNFKLKRIITIGIALTVLGSIYAEQKKIQPKNNTIEPMNQPKKIKPQPKPQPKAKITIEVKPSHHHVDHKVVLEGKLRIRRYHGRDTAFIETRKGDYILYPDEYAHHPLSFRDLEYYDGDYVEIEGWEEHHDEIAVTDIRRLHNDRIRKIN